MRPCGNNTFRVTRSPFNLRRLALLRYPAVLLLAIFLSLGPVCFEGLHLAEVRAALARLPIPKLAGGVPLKRMPIQAPAHDPATCPICSALHAPAALASPARPALTLTTVWLAPVSAACQVHSVRLISTLQCRGPPALSM